MGRNILGDLSFLDRGIRHEAIVNNKDKACHHRYFCHQLGESDAYNGVVNKAPASPAPQGSQAQLWYEVASSWSCNSSGYFSQDLSRTPSKLSCLAFEVGRNKKKVLRAHRRLARTA